MLRFRVCIFSIKNSFCCWVVITYFCSISVKKKIFLGDMFEYKIRYNVVNGKWYGQIMDFVGLLFFLGYQQRSEILYHVVTLCNSFIQIFLHLQTSWIVKSKKTTDMVELCAIFFTQLEGKCIAQKRSQKWDIQ